MSLLTICVAAADEVGIERPTSIIGSPQPDAQALLRYANKAGNGMMKKVAWQALRKERTFTSVASETQTAILPSDFDRIVPETFWDRTDYQLISGPVSASRWQSLKTFGYGGTPRFAYRGDAILVIPTLGAGKTLAFEYVSNLWCESSGGTGQTAWAADSDVGVIDEELITRSVKFLFLADKSLPNAGLAAAELEDYLNMLVSNDQPTTAILTAGDIFGGGRHYSGVPGSGVGFNINTG